MSELQNVIEKLKKNKRSKITSPKDWDAEREKIETIYGATMSAEIVDLYNTTSGGFLGVGEFSTWQIFSPVEIIDASRELNVDFIKHALIPLIDCMDNDLICFDSRNGNYVMFNVVDEETFSEKNKVIDFFRSATEDAD